MPRLRRPGVDAGGVPVELLREDHPVWGGSLAAHRDAAEVFAFEQGWTVTYGEGLTVRPDLSRLREAGIPVYGCARILHERHPDLED